MVHSIDSTNIQEEEEQAGGIISQEQHFDLEKGKRNTWRMLKQDA